MPASNPAFHYWSSTSQNFDPVTPVLHLSGDYDSFTTPSLWKEIESLLQCHQEGLILDAADVTFFDASAIRVLVNTAQQLAVTSQRLTLRTPSHCVDHVLRICGLEALIDISPQPADR